MLNFWIYSYIGSFFGSISFGYFLLRYGLPDIRTLPQQIKLGLSGFAGLLIFTISALISYFLLTPMFTYALMPILTFIALIGITVKNKLFSPKTIKIAVPVVKIKQKKQEMKQAQPPAKKQKTEKINVKQVLQKIAEKTKKKPEQKTETKKEQHKIEKEQQKTEEVKKPVKLEIQPEKHEQGKPKAEVPKESPYLLHRRKEKTEEKTTEKQEAPSKTEEKRGEKELSRRERYLKRRGLLIEQAKADLTKPKELKKESAPLPIIPEEEVQLEFGEGLDLSDLESVDSLSELSSLDEDTSLEGLGGLDELSSLDSEDLSNLGGLSIEQEVKKEKGMSCPTCGAKNAKIIYCPYCGKGFCSNCSLKVQRKGDLVIYQCPNCKKEVIVKEEKKGI